MIDIGNNAKNVITSTSGEKGGKMRFLKQDFQKLSFLELYFYFS